MFSTLMEDLTCDPLYREVLVESTRNSVRAGLNQNTLKGGVSRVATQHLQFQQFEMK